MLCKVSVKSFLAGLIDLFQSLFEIKSGFQSLVILEIPFFFSVFRLETQINTKRVKTLNIFGLAAAQLSHFHIFSVYGVWTVKNFVLFAQTKHQNDEKNDSRK